MQSRLGLGYLLTLYSLLIDLYGVEGTASTCARFSPSIRDDPQLRKADGSCTVVNKDATDLIKVDMGVQ